MAEERKITTFTTPILVGLLVVASFLVGMFWTKIRYLEREGERAGEQEERIAQVSPAPEEEAVLGEELPFTIGNFLVTEDELCQEDGRPVVYFFGGSFCPHCQWEHPIVEGVAEKFENQISFHNNMDNQEADRDIWEKYSQINQGGVPFMVLGCRYARVGSGENAGEAVEEENLTALICKLTGGEPAEVCEEVSDLIEQIE
jgi:thiol-disulfide isomerase/thioredoxin